MVCPYCGQAGLNEQCVDALVHVITMGGRLPAGNPLPWCLTEGNMEKEIPLLDEEWDEDIEPMPQAPGRDEEE